MMNGNSEVIAHKKKTQWWAAFQQYESGVEMLENTIYHLRSSISLQPRARKNTIFAPPKQ